MQAIRYDAPWRVRPDLGEAHARYWQRLAAPGAWWSGAERVAIAAETRQARLCRLCASRRTALSPYGVEGSHDRATTLPEATVEAVHRIVTDPSRLTRRWYEDVTARELTPERYVELVGTVVAVVSIDSFCRAIGVEPNPLPAPESGEPSGYRPASARQEEAWVPVVPSDNAGTPEADLWPANRTGWVVRAMSLVPDEVRTLADLSAAHYLQMGDVTRPEVSRGALTRAQIELVAGRVSALNQCFY